MIPSLVTIENPALSTGQHSRNCRICGNPFVGLGTLCPVHLAAQSRRRAFELQAARNRSLEIIAARERRATAARGPRTELPDELDG